MFKLEFKKTVIKWYQLRKQVSRFLIWLSEKVEPECSYRYKKFTEEILKAQLDAMTYGTGVIKVENVPMDDIYNRDE